MEVFSLEIYDDKINWILFYSKYLHNPKPCGQEKHPSFWFNTTNGMFKCEGCGVSGNATTFLSEIEGISTQEAYKKLMELAGLDDKGKKSNPKKKEKLPYNIEAYAKEKCFNAEWLKCELSVKNGSDRDGQHIKIPYKDRTGKVTATRKRYNPATKPYFKWASNPRMSFYGLWRLGGDTEYVILVEGESDTQSLWMVDEPALGVPGATNFKPEWCSDIAEIPRVYIHVEPDKGGATFKKQLSERLYSGGYNGKVYAFDLREYNVKDPSELYIKYGMDAADMIKTALKNAELLDLKAINDDIPEAVEGMPIKLKVPEGWQLSDKGVFRQQKDNYYKNICTTPIIILGNVRNIDTGEEKIQIAFKTHGRWKTEIYPATTIYQARNIGILADVGVKITSENAKNLVAFLYELEAENAERLRDIQSVSQLGWADEKHFLPTNAGDIILDVERNMTGRVQAYRADGDYGKWRELMNKHRNMNKRFRFILAAAFAPPLLRLLNQRIFFVYNWGGSEGGKTAALHAALSVWGNPESLKVSFNATKVGLEYTAAFYKDLPLGLNERQLAGDRQDSVEQIVYMLAEGSSKIRGMKGGGLQAIKQWRTIVIATGEVELAGSSSQTGVSTRVLEVYGSPFDDKRDASNIYPFTVENHGHAGSEFMRRLIAEESGVVTEVHDKIRNELINAAPDRSISHVDAVSTISTADYFASQWIWNESPAAALNAALDMGKDILLTQPTDQERDVNENAMQFVIDWIISNKERFGIECYGERYGFNENQYYYIIPSVLKSALERVGYTQIKTLRYLCERDVITKKGKSYSVVKYFEGRTSRYIEFDFDKASSLTSRGEKPNDDDQLELEDLENAPDDLPF